MRDKSRVYLGIDVGTGSARAAVFNRRGVMLGSATHDIQTWHPEPNFVEQSSDNIWRTVCACARDATAEAGVDASAVAGIGFDATCSLVALDADNRPVSVDPDGDDERNIIVWMDHRALDQTARINDSGHDVLRYVGGRLSPEMQSPKLLWLKENLPESWSRAARFLDLPDFLTYRATGDDTRSLCSTVCKWTYLGHEQCEDSDSIGRWDDSFFNAIGLSEFVRESYRRIGARIQPMGKPVGSGLTESASAELGLNSGTPVGVSIIDAHAGGIGLLGAAIDDHAPDADAFNRRIALIGGTSSCHMAVSREPRYISGVWGPYYSAMLPEFWLTEGGQSATGALIDHVIHTHARAAELTRKAALSGQTLYDLLNTRLSKLSERLAFPAELTRDLHVLPYFHGNRSPRADASLRGVVSGLTLGDTVDDLARLYLATIQAVAHGTKHIIDTLNEHGYAIDTIFACGGGTKNPVFLREHADITGCRLVLPREAEAVLLGAAILGARAAGDYASLPDAMAAMSAPGKIIDAASGATRRYHHAKHAVFQRMYGDFVAYRELMSSWSPHT